MKTKRSAQHSKGSRAWSMSTKYPKPSTMVSFFRTSAFKRIFLLLLLTNAVSALLFLFRLIGADNFRYWFMLWNLVLAWIAPFIALWLVRRLRYVTWKHWSNIALTIAWLLFLPNSFYMVSDLVHVRQTGEVSIIYDAVLFTSFIFNGFIAGYIGTFLVHRELLRRFSVKTAYALVFGVFALCSYAIYLGRVLRWNTWDALLQPAAVLFDVSDTFIRPGMHSQAFVITISFTVLIGVFYLLAYELLRIIRTTKN